jgi:fibro-slime domain-containing protein
MQRNLGPLWLAIGVVAACSSDTSGDGRNVGTTQSEAGAGRHGGGAPATAAESGRASAARPDASAAGPDASAARPDASAAGPDAGAVRDTGPDGAAADGCSTTLRANVRDFRVGHPDFENPALVSLVAVLGIVRDELGADRKPVYASNGPTRVTTGPKEFAQWYNDVPGVNATFQVEIPLTKDSTGKYVYDNLLFFPIDGKGPNEGVDAAGKPHNFHFTTEIHTQFQYRGGEVFTFLGDDDVWVFINGRLAIDLGGLHRALRSSVDLDASATKLGLARGQRYGMDIFHAERMAKDSNFHIETTIECLIPVVLL